MGDPAPIPSALSPGATLGEAAARVPPDAAPRRGSRYRLLGDGDAPTEVDSQTAEEGLASGTLRTAQPLRLRHASGSVYEVPADQVAAALASGRFALDTPEDAERREYAREHGDIGHVGVTAAASTLRGATLGASEGLEEGLGIREDIDRLSEANPTAAMGGEIGGALLTALPSGGESLLGRAVMAPGRAVMGLGETAGALTTRALTREGSSLLGRVAARGVGGVVEGAVQMGGTEGAHILTEDALGEDPGDVADRVIGAMTLGGVVGGATHGATGLFSEGASAGARGARHTADLFRRQFLSQTGEELQPALAQIAESAVRRGIPFAQAVSGDADGVVPRLFGPGGRRAREVLIDGQRAMDRHIAGMDTALSEVARARHVLEQELHGAHKVRALAAVIDGEQGAAQMAASEGLVGQARALSERIDASAARYGQGGEFGPQAGRIAQRMRGAVERAEDRIAAAATGLERGSLSAEERSAETFAAMDQLRREMGSLAARARGVEPLEEAFYRLRGHLENGALWGEEAAALQRETNEALHREINWGGDFDRLFMREGESAGFDRVMMADSQRIASHLGGAGSAANATNERVAQQAMQATSDLADAVVRNRGGVFSPEGMRAAEELRTASRRLREMYSQATEDASLLRQAGILQQGAGFRALGAQSLGTALGGPALGAVAAAVSSPVHAARALGTIERLMRQTDGRITSSVRAFLGRSTTAAERASRRALDAGTVAVRASYRGVQAYEARVRELSLHRDPSRLSQDIAERTADLTHTAPRVTAALQATAARATTYLQQHQPRGRVLPGTLIPSRDALPSRAEMDAFLRVARAVDDPASVLDDLRRRELTPEAVAAIRDVYPALYQRIVRAVSEELARPGAHPSYQDRIQLGTLLGIPTDPSLTPATIALLQEAHAMVGQAAEQQQQASQASAPDLSGTMASGMDRIEARRQTA